jgi:hypothetical protein
MLHQKLTVMKNLILLFLLSLFSSVGTAQQKGNPIIDMHIHVYTPQNYWGGSDFVLEDTVMFSPANYDGHIKAVIQQKEKYNIVLSYASGNSEALDSINKNYPNLFLSSAEIMAYKEIINR